jgi:alanine-synthesizing transaminase
VRNQTFSDRLVAVLEQRGLKQADLVRMAAERGKKLGKSQVSQYVSGKVTPRRDVLELLTSILGVEEDWLDGTNPAAEPALAPIFTPAPPSQDPTQRSTAMREFKKSSKLENVLYDVRGPVVDEAARMEAEGQRILKLNIGNPAPFGFRTPDEVVSDMRQQLTDCEGYSDSRGLFSARKAIMQYAQLKNLPNVDMEGIYTGNGVSELIQLCMQALLDNGDEILIPSPDYPLWTACATLAGGTPVHYLCDEDAGWYPDLADMESKVTPRTKALVIINPNNPTGAVYPREVLEEIAELARRHQLMIFSDEIYDRLCMDGEKHVSIASLVPDLFCVTFSGLSKSHMVAGYRIGWMVLSGNKRCARDFVLGINMLSNMRLCSNVPAQSIVQTALGGYQSVERYVEPGGRILEQRDYVYEALNAIDGVTAVKPKAAFYIFPKIDAKKFNITDDEQFALDLLHEKRILVTRGGGFNWDKPDHFRVVYLPRMGVLHECMEDLADFLSDYRQA